MAIPATGATRHAQLTRLLRPRSVVIVGASPTPGALGQAVLANLERAGFAGDIHLVNPKRSQIAGRPCLASIADLPAGVDAAVLAIPRDGVLGAVAALADRGVGAAVIFSAGFAEGGEQGLREQVEIARIARDSGMVIEGPNCLGLVNYVDRTPLTFVQTQTPALGDRPGLAIVSQSGAMAAVLSVTLLSRGLGLSYFVSTGNEAERGVEDYVDVLVDDPSTQVIAMVVEQFRDPAAFLRAAQRARQAGKTIVLLHPGASQAARDSAATHTGAMAGDHEVMRVKVSRVGVIVAATLEELGDIAEIVSRCPPLRPSRPDAGVAVVGESGAFKALMLDYCEALNLPLPAIHDANAPTLRAAMPGFVPVSNPLDLTAQGLVDPAMYDRVITALLGDDRFAAVVIGVIQTDDVTMGIKAPPITLAVSRSAIDKPVIYAGLDEGAPISGETIDRMRALGIPCFPSAERVFRALKAVFDHVGRDATIDTTPGRRLDLKTVSGVVPEYRAKALLGDMPFPVGRFAATLDQAQALVSEIGWPVALKAQSADLSHKSDAGGVILNVRDAMELDAAWARMQADVARHAPDVRLDGILIEAMGARGVEMIVGARNDPQWGPVVLAGFGGVQAEILKDVRLMCPDLSQDAVIAELLKLKSAALLTGFRASPPLDLTALARLIVQVGALMRANPSLDEIDLNPVVVHPVGQGVVILDALMLVRPLPG